MKNRYLLSIILMALLATPCADAINISRLWCSKTFDITYTSVDADNMPVTLSACITYPTRNAFTSTPAEAKFIILNNHGTLTADKQAPTGSDPLDAVPVFAKKGAMTLAASDYGIVISCDYLGYGVSANRRHPYCNPTLTARNVIDGFMAALDTIRARDISLSEDYYTYNVGYSQGGEVTMAVQRYLETMATSEQRAAFRLKRSIAGAGPYDLNLMLDKLTEDETLAYAVSIPLTLETQETAYKEGCMKMIDAEKFYRDPSLRKKIIEMFDSKQYTTDQISQAICEAVGKDAVNFFDVISDSIRGNGPYARAVRKALSKCNLLNGEWIPQTPMILYHYTGDRVVYYENSLKAMELFGDKATLYTNRELDDEVGSVLRDLVDIFGNVSETHSGYGIVFYMYVLSGAFIGGAL